jgi:hypothetical protein
MIEKQFKKAVIVITILLVGLIFGLVTTSKADEVLPKSKPLHVKMQGWVEQEWNDIKQYQTNSWEDSKAQLSRNKDQLISIWNKLTNN